MAKQRRNDIIDSIDIRPESYNRCTVKVRPAHRRDGRANKAGLSKRQISTACVARFHSKFKVSRGCWLWTAGKFRDGYGMLNLGRDFRGKQHTEYAHRIAYVLTHGDIPQGRVVMHLCDVPACVNPFHLRLGDNIADARAKGKYLANGMPRRRKVAA